jgi:hypothetical protein
MSYELEKEDKINIIDSHIRSLTYSKYNTEISLLLENESIQPDSKTLQSLNEKINELSNKIQKLEDTKIELNS